MAWDDLSPIHCIQVNGGLDDDNSPSWNHLRNQCFNGSDALLPVLEEARRSAPGYAAKVGISAGQDLFLPPKITNVVTLGCLAAIMSRSHADMRKFCAATCKLIVTSPSVHLALVGRVFRLMRFRRWRLLFVRTALFRLRYQVNLKIQELYLVHTTSLAGMFPGILSTRRKWSFASLGKS